MRFILWAGALARHSTNLISLLGKKLKFAATIWIFYNFQIVSAETIWGNTVGLFVFVASIHYNKEYITLCTKTLAARKFSRIFFSISYTTKMFRLIWISKVWNFGPHYYILMPCPSRGPKIFWVVPHFLCRTKNLLK